MPRQDRPASARCKIKQIRNPAGGRLLYWLLYQKLFPYFRPFRIFRYLTFRTAFATITALLITLIIGPYVIEKLREFQIGQYVRDDGPKAHQKKAGTPTMGGLLICIAILLPTLLWSDLSNPFVWLVMLSTLAYGGDRLCRRLHQSCRAAQPRADRAGEDALSDIGRRRRRRGPHCFAPAGPVVEPVDPAIYQANPARPGVAIAGGRYRTWGFLHSFPWSSTWSYSRWPRATRST